ncbi:MAG: AAA family ATPase, partial [Proteobacteria bacterium]|nr:AAA family ATPase [Pseudomonadota bacterium]
MYIEKLTLRNFRRYETASFYFHQSFNVLIGNNGKGKTTILDALSIMLNTYFLRSGIQTGGTGIKKDDA